MRLEIEPEPTPEEREAIAAAVRALSAERDGAPPAWWQAGLRESLEEEQQQE
jgi:hypothetical protein